MIYNLNQIEEISNGDINFKQEMIEIFKGQIPEFISNMEIFYKEEDLQNLAKEAHTAKSSVLIFGMEETAKYLKEIQLFGERENKEELSKLLPHAIEDLKTALKELGESIIQ